MLIDYSRLSLWLEQVPAIEPRPYLTEDTAVDVAIVGGGLTGLWTAYYLTELDSSLRIAVVESQVVGFGASGRNGGWCSALYPVSLPTLAKEAGRSAAIAQYAAMRDTVHEVVDVARREAIDADIAVGGTIVLARSDAQYARAHEEFTEAREYGEPLELLGPDAARARLNATHVLGATYTPHCAAVQPAKLVRGLADVVEQRGVTIYELTHAQRIEPGAVRTRRGTIYADHVVRATEGYTPRLAGMGRAVAPVYSLIIATEPLPQSMWDEIGLRARETFSDFRHLIIYGQRTADGRMVFGGRGAPYHFGSRIRPAFDRNARVFAELERALHGLFPVLRGVAITHRWGGPLGIARDWHASVGHEPTTGLAWAGGYVGDGVSTTNLAGRTLADLITARPSELTSLPWVGHRSRDWEPEPLRWLGANAALHAMTWADHAEARRGKPSKMAALVNGIIGR